MEFVFYPKLSVADNHFVALEGNEKPMSINNINPYKYSNLVIEIKSEFIPDKYYSLHLILISWNKGA